MALGIRECFTPRPGMVYASCDVDQLELRTLGQVCLRWVGHSKLAQVLNAGRDPHTSMGAKLAGISYDEGVKLKKNGDPQFDAKRQLSKALNFGFPGGLGPRKFITFAGGAPYKIKFHDDENEAIRIVKGYKREWLEEWPEMPDYFRYITGLPQDDFGFYTVTQLFTNRIRGGCSFTAAANSGFQGLGADAAHRAGWYLSKACYAEPDSVLYGSRIVLFAHDEWILEVPEFKAHECATEMARVAIKGLNEFLPDVPAKSSPQLMQYWSKKAFAITDKRTGRLVPWAGHKKNKDGTIVSPDGAVLPWAA